MTGQLVTVENMPVSPNLRHLFLYLVQNGLITPIEQIDESQIDVFPSAVLQKIQSGDPAWEAMVPPQVVRLVKEHGYFNYPKT